MIHVLTSRPDARPCATLLARARELGVPMRAGPARRFAAGDVVFAYGAGRSLLGAVAGSGALVLNGIAYSKHEQYLRLVAAGIPVPRWRQVPRGRLGPEQLAQLGGGAVIVKPDFGGFGAGVKLVERPSEAAAMELRRAHVVQEFVPCGGRCARLVVLGDRVAATIDRVARDGVVAAYSNGRKGWLEPFHPTEEESSLSVAAARALGIEIAGVDLIRSAAGPRILEVNHRFVPFHLRAMYGDVLADIVHYLQRRHQDQAPSSSSSSSSSPPSPRRSWRLPRAVGSWFSLHSTQQRVANGRR